MIVIDKIMFPSGASIAAPLDRLLKFCEEEYVYYDGIPFSNPDIVEPVDVLATVSVNSYINRADVVRNVHKGMSERCNGLLARIPESVGLLDYDLDSGLVHDLLHAAVQVTGVLIPVATKILHRKRPYLIPMLDNVVIDYYLKAKNQGKQWPKTQDKRFAASTAMMVLASFREDLAATAREVRLLKDPLAERGFTLSPVRILELLVWTEVEPRGYYR